MRRAFTLALYWLLATHPALSACPTVKESAEIDILHLNDTTVHTTFTTAGPRKILAVPINWRSSSYAPVIGVSGGSLSWSRRGTAHQMTSATCFGIGAPCFVDVEVWEADATAPLVSELITASWNAGALAGAMALIAFDGTPLTFDSDVVLPAFNSNASGADSVPSVSGVSTVGPSGLLLSFCEWNTVPGSFCAPPTGWSSIGGASNYQPFNARYMAVNIAALAVASPQSSITVLNTGNATTAWMAFVDALTCDSPPGPNPNPVRRPFAHGWPW